MHAYKWWQALCMGLYINISLRFVHTRQKSQISDVSAAFISDEGCMPKHLKFVIYV